MKRYAVVRGVPGRLVTASALEGSESQYVGQRRKPLPESEAKARAETPLAEFDGKNTPDQFEVFDAIIRYDQSDEGRTNVGHVRDGDLVLVREIVGKNIADVRSKLAAELAAEKSKSGKKEG